LAAAALAGSVNAITIRDRQDLVSPSIPTEHISNDTWAFAIQSNDDLVAIKKINTESGTTEVHVLSAASNYQNSIYRTGTALHETDDTFAFAVKRNNDLVAIKKSSTDTRSTEVHVLSASSNYQHFVLQTGTPLHETDDTWAFAMKENDDIMAIHKSETDTHSTEVLMLSAASDYKEFVLHTGTALHETDDEWAFAMKRNGDVVAIKRGGTTELQVLATSSNFQTFALQTRTALHETDDTWAFAMKKNDDLLAIKKGSVDRPTTEVILLSAASQYQESARLGGAGLIQGASVGEFARRSHAHAVDTRRHFLAARETLVG